MSEMNVTIAARELSGTVAAVASGSSLADAAASVAASADIYSMAEGFTNKIFVAYAPYTA